MRLDLIKFDLGVPENRLPLFQCFSDSPYAQTADDSSETSETSSFALFPDPLP